MKLAWRLSFAAAALSAAAFGCHQGSTADLEIVKLSATRSADGHVTVMTTLECFLVGTIPQCSPASCVQAAWVAGTDASHPDYDASAAVDTVVACEGESLGEGDSVTFPEVSHVAIPPDAGLTIVVQQGQSDAGPFDQGGMAIPSP